MGRQQTANAPCGAAISALRSEIFRIPNSVFRIISALFCPFAVLPPYFTIFPKTLRPVWRIRKEIIQISIICIKFIFVHKTGRRIFFFVLSSP